MQPLARLKLAVLNLENITTALRKCAPEKPSRVFSRPITVKEHELRESVTSNFISWVGIVERLNRIPKTGQKYPGLFDEMKPAQKCRDWLVHRPEEDNWEDMEKSILSRVPDWKYAAVGAVHRTQATVDVRRKAIEKRAEQKHKAKAKSSKPEK